jgi:flagellin
LRITNNAAAYNSYKQHGITNGGADRSVQEPYSVRNSSSRPYEAMGIVGFVKSRVNNRGLSEIAKTAQENISLIQTAENSLQKADNILHRMHGLASLSADISYQDLDRVELDLEYTQLKFELCELSTVRFNGLDLLSTDEAVTLTFETGAGAKVTTEVTVDALDAGSLGNIGTPETARDAASNIGDTLGMVTTARETLGDVRESLEYGLRSPDVSASGLRGADSLLGVRNAENPRNLENQRRTENMRDTDRLRRTENLRNEQNRNRDTEAVRKMVDSARNSILQQSLTAVHAQANTPSVEVLRLVV